MTDRIRQAVMEDLERITQVESMCFPPAEAAGHKAFEDRLKTFPDSFFCGGERWADCRIYQWGRDG